jgi:dihydrofolate synthase/folylpolyglutamate synthase
VIRAAPTVVLDAAHNPAGAAATAAAVETDFDFSRLVGVLGVMSDKDARGILAAFEPVLAEVVITAVPGPRSMDPDALAAQAVEIFGEDRVEVVPRLTDAIEAAIALAEEGAEELSGIGVLVTGSVVLAGAARHLLRRKG